MNLLPNDIVLFQGDSITDAGRDRSNAANLGTGYALMTAATLRAEFAELNLTCVNRGVSGDRTKDLLARWDDDCLELRPTVLSIMIGINNVWRRYDQDDPTEPERFEREYRSLLEQARAKNVREIVMLEPFLLPYPADRQQMREDLDPKITVCRTLAREFEAYYVPLDGLFAAAAARAPEGYWAEDGVHPSPAGHALISNAWLGLLT
jgi:lysophospholipase L1-like esterase